MEEANLKSNALFQQWFSEKNWRDSCFLECTEMTRDTLCFPIWDPGFIVNYPSQTVVCQPIEHWELGNGMGCGAADAQPRRKFLQCPVGHYWLAAAKGSVQQRTHVGWDSTDSHRGKIKGEKGAQPSDKSKEEHTPFPLPWQAPPTPIPS